VGDSLGGDMTSAKGVASVTDSGGAESSWAATWTSGVTGMGGTLGRAG
jgi:hypothetical protein